MKKLIKIIFSILFLIGFFGFLIIAYIHIKTNFKIFEELDDIKKDGYDTAVVLGAGIKNNEPSLMLKDRLDAAIHLYKNKVIKKIIMSGDGIDYYYNEVRVMSKYALRNGVEEKDIILDNEGTKTAETFKNLKNKFNIKKVVIISQKFHLNRALMLAEKNKIDAIAYPAVDNYYKDLFYLYFRDYIALIKDFILN